MGDRCANPGRVDGDAHSWRFDGDDPRIICVFCDEMRDALSGFVYRLGEPSPLGSPSDIDGPHRYLLGAEGEAPSAMDRAHADYEDHARPQPRSGSRTVPPNT